MDETRIIKRYNAYYHGWCLTFGEHTADYEDDRDINWLFGEERFGLILSPGLRRKAQREFLGQQEEVPELHLSDGMVRVNEVRYRLENQTDKGNVRLLIDFLLDSREIHMFLCNHLFYPRTRIITFAREKPLIIMYKEMQPLKLIVEQT